MPNTLNKSLEPIVGEYKTGFFYIKIFVLKVSNILESILERDNYKYQISHRIKSLESLRKK